MRSMWRVLLTWLLVLAMPVQGSAAVGMQHCGPTHERMHPGVMAVSAPHGHGQERHNVAVATDAAPAAADTAAMGELDHAAASASSVSTEDATCSACAACCLALGLPAAGPLLAAVAAGPSLAQLPRPVLPSFVPGGLERPPRPFRA